MKVGGKFSAFDISSVGLSIQRKRMNLIAENIANAETTRTDKDGPYKRLRLRLRFPRGCGKLENTSTVSLHAFKAR